MPGRCCWGLLDATEEYGGGREHDHIDHIHLVALIRRRRLNPAITCVRIIRESPLPHDLISVLSNGAVMGWTDMPSLCRGDCDTMNREPTRRPICRHVSPELFDDFCCSGAGLLLVPHRSFGRGKSGAGQPICGRI